MLVLHSTRSRVVLIADEDYHSDSIGIFPGGLYEGRRIADNAIHIPTIAFQYALIEGCKYVWVGNYIVEMEGIDRMFAGEVRSVVSEDRVNPRSSTAD